MLAGATKRYVVRPFPWHPLLVADIITRFRSRHKKGVYLCREDIVGRNQTGSAIPCLAIENGYDLRRASRLTEIWRNVLLHDNLFRTIIRNASQDNEFALWPGMP